MIIIYKNYIFDFGQVLVRFDPWYMTNAYVKNEKDCALVSEVVFDRLYWDRLDIGSINDEEVKAGICSRLPQKLQNLACKVYDNWIYNLPLIKGMKELVFELKTQGKGLYLLSNISNGFSQKYQSVPEISELLSLFDGLVFSGPIGKVKPTKDIYYHILSKYSLKANECFFIDDNQSNIVGSESVGIAGYLFDGDVKKLSEFLNIKKCI